jgi:flagellar biosynthesis protein FliR
MPAPELSPVLEALRALFGADLAPWLRAWARVMPVLIVVPAFGAAAVPAAARAGLGVALAAAIAPSLEPSPESALPLGLSLLREAALGAPVAFGAAILVYTAVMAGGAVDDLRGARETTSLPVFEGQSSPHGALLGLLVIVAFLEFGGGARVVSALTRLETPASAWSAVAIRLSASIEVALAAAAPLAVAAIVLSVAEGLIARAAVPAHVTALLSPLRGVALLALFALLLERIVEVFALAAHSSP